MLLICSSLKKTVDYLLGMDVKYLGEFNAIFGTALGYMYETGKGSTVQGYSYEESMAEFLWENS
jgi:hypothetical protein